MGAQILLIATLDTKETEAAYLKQLLEAKDVQVIVMDTGVLAAPRKITPAISREEVALAGGMDIDTLVATGNKGKCIDVMIKGAQAIAKKMFAAGEFDGVISFGGAQGTNIGTAVMKNLPFGVPKLMVSTVASGTATFGPFVGTKDVLMMHSVVDVQGTNSLITRIFENAAAAICGMVKNNSGQIKDCKGKKAVALSMLGTTTPGALRAQKLLEAEGYEVIAFHQNGTGGIAMEDLIGEGFFCGVLDLNLHEIADRLVGGLHGSIADYRLETAAAVGIPQIIAPGSIGYSVQGPVNTLSSELKKRKYIIHNPTLTLVRLTPEELSQVAEVVAEKLNKARGPIKVLLPLKGFSFPNREGEELWDPSGNQVFIETFKAKIAPSIAVEEVNAHINDAEFIDQVVANFLNLQQK